MLFPWLAATMLAAECNNVIGLRMFRLMTGGQDAADEAQLMIGEKVHASIEANMALMGGASMDTVIHRYRELVAANKERLTFN